MNATKRLTTNLSINTSEMNVLFVHSALDDYPLTPEEFRAYAHLARRASSGAAYPSRASIAKACRMHEDTVGVVLKNLLTFKMLEAHERKGKTTLYTLTPASKWVKPQIVEALHAQQAQAGAAKRADRKARKAAAGASLESTDPPETKGGVEEATPPKRRVGYPPETKGHHPPETKGYEGDPLRRSIEGRGVIDVTSNPGEEGSSSASVAEPDTAAHSSSKNLNSTPTPEGLRNSSIFGAALASLVIVPQVEASQPDGTAHAVEQDLLVDSQDFAEPRGGMNEQATSLENVPGGAAGAGAEAVQGARGAGDGAGRAGVDSIRPVDAQELAARPVEPVDGAAYQELKSLVGGKNLVQLTKELTRTGGLSREAWLKLKLGEVQLVRVLAQQEAKATGGNMLTLAVRGLDRLIGAVRVEKRISAAAVNADPQLQPGQRCTVADQVGVLTLGVVQEVNAVRYKIQFDDGNGRNIDRTVAAQLCTLKPSDAPLPVAAPVLAPEGPTLFVPTGTSWRRKAGKGGQIGELVTVRAVLGNKRELSNGVKLFFYEIQRDFEQVQA